MWSSNIRVRTFRIMAFSFATTLSANIMNPGLFGHKILDIAPAGFHNTFLGLLTFIWSIITVFNLPVVGSFSDQTRSKLGKRFPFFILGALGMAGAAFAVTYSNSFGTLLIAVVFLSLFDDTIIAPWLAYFREETPAKMRGEAAGYKALVDILAVVLGRQLAGTILSQVTPGNENLIIMLPVTIGAALLLSLWLTPQSKIEAQSRTTSNPLQPIHITSSISSAFKVDLKAYPDFTWWLINRFFFWMAFIILGTFTLFYALDALELGQAEAQRIVGNLTTIIGVAILAIAIPAGRLADRIGRKSLIFWACIFAAGGTAILLLEPNQTGIWVSGLMVGIGAGTYMSSNLALLTDIVPKEAAARFFGLAGVASALGGAIARLFGGLVVDPINLLANSDKLGHLVLFGFASLFFVISAFAVLKVKSTHTDYLEVDSR